LLCLHIKTIILQLCLHERYTFVPKFWHQLLLIWPIMVLQEKRKEDPYREFVPRVLYESISGMKNKAPTFTPVWLILRQFPKMPKLCKHVWQPVAPDSRWIPQSNWLFLRQICSWFLVISQTKSFHNMHVLLMICERFANNTSQHGASWFY
jgi:hypothetical protein